MDVIYSPIKPASGWSNAPADAKECTMIHSKGLIHRPCLILKNEQGIYDTMQIFTSKKESEPLAVLKAGEYVKDVIDDAILEKNDEKIKVNRNMRILEMAEDGSHIRMWISSAMDFHNDTLWYPKSLLPEIVKTSVILSPVQWAAAKTSSWSPTACALLGNPLPNGLLMRSII